MRLALLGLAAALSAAAGQLPRDTGYRGIWYQNQPTGDRYVYKYSGGFATYPQQQSPIAIYSARHQKTFFCYGGTEQGRQELLHMVSYYDHRTGLVPRPVILVNKKTDDAHDNPVLAMDDQDYLWVFSNAHGISRPSYIWRSDRPADISAFTLVRTTNFSYGHPWYIPGEGFLFLHTLYQGKNRGLVWTRSPDGVDWSAPAPLANAEMGHYQITARTGRRVGMAFNVHPKPVGLNQRTNLYYLETADMGRTWRTAGGQPVATPVTTMASSSLVHDYRSEGRLVYLKTLEYDPAGRPVILFLTSAGYEPGERGGTREWKTARWTGTRWEIRDFTTSDHNYDFGPLAIEPGGAWRVIAPTAAGPQPGGTGGDIEMWVSRNHGRSWKKTRRLTESRTRSHTYVKKPVNAHRDFYALWADGDVLKPSGSNLYFTDREGTAVWRLPAHMSGDFARPERFPTPLP
jgi:hypothetical protein